MWGIKNTVNEILSIHTQKSDANDQLVRLGGSPLILIEDTKENLVTNLKQSE